MNNRDQETKPSALLGFSVKGGSVRWDYGEILIYLGMLLSIPVMVYAGYRCLVPIYNALSVGETGEVAGAVRYNVAFIFLLATAALMMYVRNRKKNPELAKVNQLALTAAAIAAVLSLVLLTTYS